MVVPEDFISKFSHYKFYVEHITDIYLQILQEHGTFFQKKELRTYSLYANNFFVMANEFFRGFPLLNA